MRGMLLMCVVAGCGGVDRTWARVDGEAVWARFSQDGSRALFAVGSAELPEGRVALHALDVASGKVKPVRDQVEEASLSEVALSAGGDAVAYWIPYTESGVPWHRVAAVWTWDEGTVAVLDETHDGALAFDGRGRLLHVDADWALRSFDPTSGEDALVAPSFGEWIVGRDSLAYALRGEVHVVGPDAGEDRVVATDAADGSLVYHEDGRLSWREARSPHRDGIAIFSDGAVVRSPEFSVADIPALDPDWTALAFACAYDADVGFDLCVWDLDTGGVEEVAKAVPRFDRGWAGQSGRLLYFDDDDLDRARLMLWEPGAGGPRQVDDIVTTGRSFFDRVGVSSAGDHVVYERGSDIKVARLDEVVEPELISEGFRCDGEIFAPDGSELLFRKTHTLTDAVCVWTLRGEGAEPRSLRGMIGDPIASADGRHAVFAEVDEERFQLVARDLEAHSDRVLRRGRSEVLPLAVSITHVAVAEDGRFGVFELE